MSAQWKWLLIFTVWSIPCAAEDWPQWMGPNRDDIWEATGIIDSIPKEGLPVRWRVPISGGYAGPAVVGDKVYVTDYVRASGDASNSPNQRMRLTGKERVLCLSDEDGRELWKHEYDCPYEISYPAGPRCTPTVDGDRVYTLGSEGHLFCLNAETGAVIWSKHFPTDYKATVPHWGYSSHPLVHGDLLYCVVGGPGSVAVAFDKKTGEERWRALTATDQAYCPPTLIHASGRDQLLIWDSDNINSLNPETGEVLWKFPLQPQYHMSIMAPRLSGDLLFASGIGNVAALLKLDPQEPKVTKLGEGNARKWVYCANSTPFIEDGVIYGADCRTGGLRAVNLTDGEWLWETYAPTTGSHRMQHGTAFLTKHGDRFFLFSETGDLILAKLSREKYEELGRFQVLEPTGEGMGRNVVWTHPAYANGSAYCRNDKEIVSVSLKKE